MWYFLLIFHVFNKEGHIATLCFHSAHVPCKLVEITALIDKTTGKATSEKPKYLKKRDLALVKMVPLKPISLETYISF